MTARPADLVRRLRRNTTTPARRRGVTLLEVVVVTAVSAVMLALIARWVVSLVVLAVGVGEAPQTQLTEARIVADLSRDTATARPCDPWGLAQPVRSVTPTTLVVTADVTGDTLVDEITWAVDGTDLTRTVTAGAGGCTFTGTPATVVVATGVAAKDLPGGAWYFAPVADGNIDPARWGSCTGADADTCGFDAVAVDLVALTGDSPAQVRFDAPLNTGWTAL